VQDRRINFRVGIKSIADVTAGNNLAQEFINRSGAAPMQMLGVTPDGGIVWGGPHLRPPPFRAVARSLLSRKSRGIGRRRALKAERPCRRSPRRRSIASKSDAALMDLIVRNFGTGQ
jgi:hypothetical protein